MEQLNETITLDVEESNELAFKIKVEGASTPAKVRLICEGSEVSYMFPGRGTSDDGVVQFVIPQMKGKLQEGTYAARVEVLIENRYFSPVQFQLNFKKTMQVFAESIQLVQKAQKPEIKVTASPIIVAQQPKPEPKQESKPLQVAPIQQEAAKPVKPQQPIPPQRTGAQPLTLREKFSKSK